MPRITASQYHELEEKCQRLEEELTQRTRQHMEELKNIQSRLAELEAEARKQEQEENDLRARLQESEEALQKEVEAHADTKRVSDHDREEEMGQIAALHATLEQEREHSANVLAYLLASLVGTFGAAVAAVWSVRCQQEPEL